MVFSVLEFLSGCMGVFGLFGDLSRVAPFAGMHRPVGGPLGREDNGPAKTEPDARLNHPLGVVRLS